MTEPASVLCRLLVWCFCGLIFYICKAKRQTLVCRVLRCSSHALPPPPPQGLGPSFPQLHRIGSQTSCLGGAWGSCPSTIRPSAAPSAILHPLHFPLEPGLGAIEAHALAMPCL